ncbi:MAG: hypothetical protein KDI31_16505, partial [Pseudomonadales bacterium]|nr:hypothetical protein [Pseudomonadales bacterium]
IGAAAGSIIEAELGLPAIFGGVFMLGAVVALNYFGRDWVTRILASWSLLLYAVFIAYFLAVMNLHPVGEIIPTFSFDWRADWVVGGFQYAFYNVSGIPIILYSARAIESRNQAISAGLIGGLVAMIPAMLFHLSFAGAYPGILDQALPVYSIFAELSLPVLQTAYLVVLFGTFIETGAGNIQGFIERLDTWWRERRGVVLGRGHHAVIAGTILLLSGTLSSVGIVDLIASGYGTLAWGFLFVYLLPLFTVGLWRLRVVRQLD